MKRSFEGLVAWVTGASSGIGAAVARELSQRGASVVVSARRIERLEAVVRAIEAGGGKALAVACDVAHDGDAERTVEATIKKFGRLDIVLANAGFGVSGTVEDLTLDDFRRQFETNVFGVLRTGKAAIPELKKSKGRMGIVGSVTGFIAIPSNSPYAMSKFAVNALSHALYHEMRSSGVSVTHIAPGYIESEFRQVDNQGAYNPAAHETRPSWILVPTKDAARAIVNALESRKREAVISLHGKIIVFAARYLAWAIPLAVGLFKIRGRNKK